MRLLFLLLVIAGFSYCVHAKLIVFGRPPPLTLCAAACYPAALGGVAIQIDRDGTDVGFSCQCRLSDP